MSDLQAGTSGESHPTPSAPVPGYAGAAVAPPPVAPQAVQPPGAPPTGPATSTGTQPPNKKRKGCLIAVIVVAVLVLCGLAAGIAVVIGLGSSSAAEAKIVERAETHYAAAMEHVETAEAALEGVQASEASEQQVSTAVDAAHDALRLSRDEVASSRAAIEELEDSEDKTAYLASLDSATEALGALEDLVAYMNTASALNAKMEQGADATSQAMDDLNAAINAGNANDYSKMKTKAKAASAGFKKAEGLFREAHKIDKSAELDKYAGYALKRKQQSDIVIRMATEGKAGKLSAYNKDIDRMEAVERQAEAIEEPAIVGDADWGATRLAELSSAIDEAAEKADELRLEALEGLGYSVD